MLGSGVAGVKDQHVLAIVVRDALVRPRDPQAGGADNPNQTEQDQSDQHDIATPLTSTLKQAGVIVKRHGH
jgi:hypothetical protein